MRECFIPREAKANERSVVGDRDRGIDRHRAVRSQEAREVRPLLRLRAFAPWAEDDVDLGDMLRVAVTRGEIGRVSAAVRGNEPGHVLVVRAAVLASTAPDCAFVDRECHLQPQSACASVTRRALAAPPNEVNDQRSARQGDKGQGCRRRGTEIFDQS